MKSTYILSKVVPATKFYNRTHFSYYLYLSYTAMHLEVIAPAVLRHGELGKTQVVNKQD